MNKHSRICRNGNEAFRIQNRFFLPHGSVAIWEQVNAFCCARVTGVWRSNHKFCVIDLEWSVKKQNKHDDSMRQSLV